jgi:anti-anti-sigma factor
LHYNYETQKITLLAGSNFPIGVVDQTQFEISEISFNQGDIFIFYSDGVTEARSSQGEFYGTERLQAFVEKQAKLDPQNLVELIKKDVQIFTEKDTFNDDFTLIIININELNTLSHLKPLTAQFNSDLSQLKTVRTFIQRLCYDIPGDSQKISDQLQLAINEAFCNIVNHGYEGKENCPILIKAEYTSTGLIINILDQGKSFDPALVNEPDLTGGSDNGFGLYIIRELADSTQYTPKTSPLTWNHLRIFKSYSPRREKMEIKHRIQDQILIITLDGESLDAKEAPYFKEKVKDLICLQNAHYVIFDLSFLQFIDSSGLGSFLSILRILNSRSGELKLACMTKPIRTVFELICMHKVFEIYHSIDEALLSFNIKG